MQMDQEPAVPSEAMKTAKPEMDDLSKQIESFQERIKNFNLLAQTQESSSATNQTEKEPEQPTKSLPNFGWTEIEGRPALPFVRRGSECYVAKTTYVKKMFLEFLQILSKETIACFPIQIYEMTQSEADVFNEINVQHCDKSLVGDYCFKPGESMADLEDFRGLVTFCQACRDVLRFKKLDNDLFGFLRIAGESEVPFIWNEGRKLVPLFYFEGQSEYLDARSEDLTDNWKLRYLKFCCLVQHIRKDHYEQNPLKVVDIEHIKELFPADTSFELHAPRDPNQELLEPEWRVTAPPCATNNQPRTAHTEDNGFNKNLPIDCSVNKCKRTYLRYNVPRDRISGNKMRHSSVGAKTVPYPSFNGVTITPTTSQESAKQVTNVIDLATITSIGSQRNMAQSQSIPGFQVARVDNVPYRSPQAASSPGCQVPSPLMNEAIGSTSPPLPMQQASYTPIEQSQECVYVKTTTQFQLNQCNWNMQQQQQQVRIMQSYPNQPPRNPTPPYTSIHQRPNQRPHVFKMTPALRERLRSFLERFLISMDARNIEYRLGEVAYTFMLENKITSEKVFREVGPHLELELKNIWKEMMQNAAPSVIVHQNSLGLPGPSRAQNVPDVNRGTNNHVGNYLPGSVTVSRTSNYHAFAVSGDEVNNNYL